MKVIKRNGKKEKFELAKWQAYIAKQCEGIADVSPSMIEIHAQPHFRDGMTTEELDQIALRAAVDLIDEPSNPGVANVNYQYVTGRMRNTMLRKSVYGSYTVPRLYDIIKKNVSLKLYTPELLEWYTEAEWDEIEKFVDHSRDESMPYAAIEQLIEKYLVQNRVTKQPYESVQVRYIVCAATLFHNEANRMDWIKEYYDEASLGNITQSTPVCAGLGTPTKQFSSCVLLSAGDSKESIYKAAESISEYASNRAGIGLEIGSIRPLGAPVKNGEIKHTGLVPFLHKWLRDLRAFSQGGIRNSSMTVAYPIWHYQVEDLLVLKNNQGTEETRIRQLDYDVVMAAFFWRRYKQEGNITLFDPAEVPDLYKAYYSNIERFEQLYVKYENDPTIKRKKTLPAATIIDLLVGERSDTGRIYIMNTDNVQRQGVFDPEIHPVLTSNLCMEILIPVVSFATNVKKTFTMTKDKALDFLLNLPKQYSNPKMIKE